MVGQETREPTQQHKPQPVKLRRILRLDAVLGRLVADIRSPALPLAFITALDTLGVGTGYLAALSP